MAGNIFDSSPGNPGTYNNSMEFNASRLDEHRFSPEVRIEFGVADVEVAVPHGLGVKPRERWHTTFQDLAGSIYIGSTAWDETNAYLKCNVADVIAVVKFELPNK